mgnify:CR=1 FL=1
MCGHTSLWFVLGVVRQERHYESGVVAGMREDMRHNLVHGRTVLISVLIPFICAMNWRSFTEEELQKWSNAVERELDEISLAVPGSERAAYYWFLYGRMKMAAYCIEQRIIFRGLDHLNKSVEVCDIIFAEDDVLRKKHVSAIKDLVEGPP